MITISYYDDNDFMGLFQLMKHWGSDYSFSEEEIKKSVENIIANTDNKRLIARKDNQIIGYAQIGGNVLNVLER